MSNASEANFSFTTKIDGDLFTVRGDDIQSFQQNLEAANQSGIGATITQMVTSVNNTGTLNSVLGATPVDPAMNPEPAQQQAPPQQEQSPWNQGGQQPQGQWGNAQPQQGNQWGAAPQQQGWGGAPQGGAPQGGGDYRNDPSIQPPHLQPPMTPNGPALYKGGFAKASGKPYRIWSDPRSYAITKNLPKDQVFSQFIKDSEL